MKSIFRFLSITIFALILAHGANAQYGALILRYTTSTLPASTPATIASSLVTDKDVQFIPEFGYLPMSPMSATGLYRPGASATLSTTYTFEPAAGTYPHYMSVSNYNITTFQFRIGGFGFYTFNAAEITALQTFNNPIEVVAFSGKKFTVTKIYDMGSEVIIVVNYHL